MQTPTVTWIGIEFTVFPPSARWNAVAGLYIFAGLNSQAQWVALYVGQTDSLVARLPTHERWLEAARLGATHIHAKVVQRQEERDRLERYLIQTLQPRLNVQLK
jgi:excinuclease UvrABC nuclease subunit